MANAGKLTFVSLYSDDPDENRFAEPREVYQFASRRAAQQFLAGIKQTSYDWLVQGGPYSRSGKLVIRTAARALLAVYVLGDPFPVPAEVEVYSLH